MKKLLIATALITGFAASMPNASAHDKYRRDRCEQPAYYQSYREDYRPSYRYYEERPVYYRPAPVVRYRSYDDEDCRPARRVYHRPGLSFLFGF